MRVPRAVRATVLLLLLTLGAARAACAQSSASLSLLTDYRLRGVSLSEQRPALTFELDQDFKSGLYAGAAVVAVGEPGGLRPMGHVEYVGYARRRADGLSWDVGLRNQGYTLYADRRGYVQYADLYAGVARGDVSLRLYYSPTELSKAQGAAYLDLGVRRRVARDWRLSGHLGVSTPLAGGGWRGGRERYDLDLGVSRQLPRAELRIDWTSAVPQAWPRNLPSGDALVAGVTVFF